MINNRNVPLVSVIVPVYNAEKYLNRCIDSIIGQSFTDFELLLINDGSIDKSGEICDEYALRDSRIRVFHKENEGVSSARNLGLNNAAGIWVAFVDSDDWVSNTYLSNLLYEAKSTGSQLVVTYPIFHYIDGRIERKLYPSVLVTEDSMSQALISNYLHGTTAPWGKLYSSAIIRNNELKFCEDMQIGEDALFFFSYLLQISQFYISSCMDYHYMFESTGSLTKRVYDYNSEYIGFCNVTDVLDNFIQQKNISDIEAVSQLNWIKGYYQRRLLNAQYYNKLPRSIRIGNLKNIDYNYYLNSVKVNSCKERILVFFLKKRLFVIYDLVRIIICSLKRYD